MKKLYLIRHAKSSWDDNSLSDIERPLNKRGKNDAPLMGRILLQKKANPNILLSSPAKRASKTAEIIAGELNFKNNISFDDRLYDASRNELLSVIKGQKDDAHSVMIFAHNPGLTQLANFLTGEEIDNIPTCGITSINYNGNSWLNIDPEKCELEFFEYPKKYK